MAGDPIRGLSDQRYFHVALVSPRRGDFGTDWVWRTLRKDCRISSGRHRRDDFADGGEIEFKTAQAPSVYASLQSRETLAIGDGSHDCNYDVFAGTVKGALIFGTGYAALTQFLVARLVKRDLLSKA